MVSCLSLFHGERFVLVATRDVERFRHECLRFWVSNFISIEVVSGMYCSTPICKRSGFRINSLFTYYGLEKKGFHSVLHSALREIWSYRSFWGQCRERERDWPVDLNGKVIYKVGI